MSRYSDSKSNDSKRHGKQQVLSWHRHSIRDASSDDELPYEKAMTSKGFSHHSSAHDPGNDHRDWRKEHPGPSKHNHGSSKSEADTTVSSKDSTSQKKPRIVDWSVDLDIPEDLGWKSSSSEDYESDDSLDTCTSKHTRQPRRRRRKSPRPWIRLPCGSIWKWGGKLPAEYLDRSTWQGNFRLLTNRDEHEIKMADQEYEAEYGEANSYRQIAKDTSSRRSKGNGKHHRSHGSRRH